jgi:hypothetical protein
MPAANLFRRAPFAFGISVGALLLAVLFIVTRASAGDGAVIYGCAQKNNGNLRVVAEGENCRPSEHPISWNQEGPQGPPGQNGADGQNGQDGADGQDGVDGQNGADGQDGQDGADGVFTGTFTSPNGQFSLIVTDAGIVLSGPSGSLTLDAASISLDGGGLVSINGDTLELRSDSASSLVSGASLDINVGTSLNIDASSNANLNAGASTNIQSGSTTNVDGSVVSLNCPAGGPGVARVGDAVGPTTILTGSTTVHAC